MRMFLQREWMRARLWWRASVALLVELPHLLRVSYETEFRRALFLAHVEEGKTPAEVFAHAVLRAGVTTEHPDAARTRSELEVFAREAGLEWK